MNTNHPDVGSSPSHPSTLLLLLASVLLYNIHYTIEHSENIMARQVSAVLKSLRDPMFRHRVERKRNKYFKKDKSWKKEE